MNVVQLIKLNNMKQPIEYISKELYQKLINNINDEETFQWKQNHNIWQLANVIFVGGYQGDYSFDNMQQVLKALKVKEKDINEK